MAGLHTTPVGVGAMKSRESGYLPFVSAIFIDLGDRCRASKVEIRRDLITIKKRLEHEGLSFLTITLPDFGKAFDEALSLGQVDLPKFSGWRTWARLPAFLRGFVRQVFDSTTGGLLDEPSIECIKAVRQICLGFKKLGLRCSPSREQAAIDRYIETERFLESFVPDSDEIEAFRKVSNLIWGSVFGDFNHHELCPKHGPGAVVEHYTQNSKYSAKRWHTRLEPYFPSDAFVFCSTEHFAEEGDKLIEVPEDQEEPVKVTLVPKTLKTPRIIAIEPCCMQYAQQSLSRYLVSRLESSWLTRGHINFSDQTVNQKLAVSASSDGQLATVDLSDASDRVSLSIVEHMLRINPDLLGSILACRSKAAKLPSGEVIPLKKFASMGSAVCFPIEAMVFYTIIIASLLREQKLPYTFRNIYMVSRDVYVYGDDIIIPVNMAHAVFRSLSLLGMKVNFSKTYVNGYFRESCGVDVYKGIKVTPTYIRSTWPKNRANVSEIISLVATGNQLWLKGLFGPLQYLQQRIERLTGPLPEVQETCSGLGWLCSLRSSRSKTRFNRQYQVEQVLTWVPGPVYRLDVLDGWSALLKFFIRTECSPANGLSRPMGIDKDHLRRTPRYGTASMKRRWVTPF